MAQRETPNVLENVINREHRSRFNLERVDPIDTRVSDAAETLIPFFFPGAVSLREMITLSGTRLWVAVLDSFYRRHTRSVFGKTRG